MVGEVVGELSMVALGDDPLESVGDKVEEVTKQFPFLRYAFWSCFLQDGHLFPLVLLNLHFGHNLQEDRMARWK